MAHDTTAHQTTTEHSRTTTTMSNLAHATLLTTLLLVGPLACGGGDETGAPPPSSSADGSATDVVAADTQQVESSAEGCPPNTLACSSGCVDPNTSATHCGTCNHPCAATEECHLGNCEAAECDSPCTAQGTTECSGAGTRQCRAHPTIAGCLEWSEVEPCPQGTVCDPSSATCRPPCADACDPFSIVLLPDTQYYTNKQADNADNTYRKQMQWILDHRQSDNIKFTIHLGDVTNNNRAEQWTVADHAHDMLDAHDVPYSIVPGNHDFLVDGTFDRGGSRFDNYFGQDRFAGKAWYGGAYGSGNTNNYTFFEVGLLKFMVVSLEYAPRKDVLCWAEDVIASHPEHRVIVATHCYLTHGGGYSGGCPNAEYLALGASGAKVWEELVSRHSNIFLVVSGHIGDSEYRVQTANAGNPVHEMLVDYQFEAACDASNPNACNDHCHAGTFTGNGWMRKLVFDPLHNSVHAETFTVEDGNHDLFPGGEPVLYCSELFNPSVPHDEADNWYSKDPSNSDHRFDFDYDMSSATSHTRTDLGKLAFIDRTVNSVGSGDQLAPKVAMASTGAFVAAWEDDSSTADGAGNHDIMARGFAPGGCSGFSDIVVNTNTAGNQQTPAIASDASGNFVVVWTDGEIRARGFAADGTQRIAEFVVNGTAQGHQSHPSIGMAPDGRFVIAWQDDRNGADQAQILMRGFAADGSGAFTERSVHTTAEGARIRPTVGVGAQGQFVVAWQDDSDGNGTWQIHGRGFGSDGSERFARITVNSEATGQQRSPSIAVSESGTFVVAWEDDQDGDGDFAILARGFATDGSASLADFRVHEATAGQHLLPSVVMTAAGDFAITWQDDADGNGNYQIHARSFRAAGAEWMAEWTVNRVEAGQQLAPHAAINGNGKLVVIWEDDMDDNGSYQLIARGIDSP